MAQKTKPACPICRRAVDWTEKRKVGSRTYVYAVHKEFKTESGRWRVKRCFLGPREGYIHGAKTHIGLGLRLRGYTDPNRVIDYLSALIKYVEEAEMDGGRKARVLKLLKDASEILEKELTTPISVEEDELEQQTT
jgi:hypothetical protein